jgi:hypothetical protein
MEVGRLQTHGLAELLPGGLAVTGLQQGVGEILVDIGAIRRESRGFFEERDGCIVVASPQGIEGVRERFVRGILSVLSQRRGGNQAESCKSNRRLPPVLVGLPSENSPEMPL